MLIWNKRLLTMSQIFYLPTCKNLKFESHLLVYASQWPASVASSTTSVHKYKCSQWQRLRAQGLGWTVPFLNSDTFAVCVRIAPLPLTQQMDTALGGKGEFFFIYSIHTYCVHFTPKKKVWFILHGGDSRLSHVTESSSVSWLLSTYSTWLHLLSRPWSKSALSSITRPRANNPTSDT